MTTRVSLMVLATAVACSAPGVDSSVPQTGNGAAATAGRAGCDPLETRVPNAPEQQPAFPEQTRACGVTSDASFEVTVLADDLVHPWAVEPLPGGDLLITERPGRMRIISSTGVRGEPIGGLPEVDARGQGGLLDVALSPSFSSDRTIFWSYTEPRDGGNGTAVASGVLAEDLGSVEQVRVLLRVMPTYQGTLHFGSRVTFGPDGMLYVTTGERSDAPMRRYAQQLDSHLGKILRIRPDGSVPDDNPFVGQDGALPEIWTLGHRNVQAAAFDADGRFWVVEHGTRGGDELNLIEKGKNYGWPIQAYGEEYSGQPIAGASTAPGDFQQPAYYWDPVIAPSGAQFHSGTAFPEWRGNLFVGSLKDGLLVRLTLVDGRVTGEEHLLGDRGQRIRDVREGPDGSLYIVTDEDNGALWRISPRL